MSFLLVRGKRYLCTSCSTIIEVEYEKGPQFTQIGDDNVLRQMELANKFNKQGEDPEIDGYYMYDFGVCQNGYTNISKKFFSNESNKQHLIKGYEQLAEEKNNLLEALSEKMIKFIEKKIECFEVNDLNKLLGYDYDPDFGDKHALPSKKRRMFNKFFQEVVRSKIIDYITNLIFNDHVFKGTIISFNDKSKKILKELGRPFLLYIIQLHIGHNISNSENLNDYIIHENTVRIPVQDTPDMLFYHKCKVSKKMLIKEILIKFDDIMWLLKSHNIEKDIKQRLETILI